jgi:ribose-phosphate pyrophosphokinase
VASLFEAVGVSQALTLDVHNVAALQNAWRIRTDHLEAKGLFVDYFARITTPDERSECKPDRAQPSSNEVVVVSPDAGGIKRAEEFRQALGRVLPVPVHSGFVEKYRSEGLVTGEAFAGDVAGKTAIIIDDLISSGTTVARAADACQKRGATAVYAAASHGLFSSKAAEALAHPALKQVVVTNTVPPFRLNADLIREKVVVLDATRLFAEAIKRIHSDGSIADLLG